MNIFVLDPDPKISASYHCDQHLHKMILESAQMLSTLAHYALIPLEVQRIKQYLYKPSYEKHPCNIWLRNVKNASCWLVDLANELNKIREDQGSSKHSSMDVISAVDQTVNFTTSYDPPKEFIFCGPSHIGLDSRLSSIHEKYQEYYKWKAKMWALDKSRRMSYKGRQIPPFLQGNQYVK